VRLQAVATEAPTLESLGVSEAVHRLLVELAGASPMLEERGGLVVVAGPDVRTRAQVLYALAGAAATAGRRVITVERRVSFVVSGFLQVELPADFGTEAASVLTQPADVIVVEDIGPPALATAALASAEQGTLVLAGLGLGSVRSALAYLATVDLRGPLLALTRGVVDVRRRGCGLTVDTVSLTPALRRDLVERKDPWTSPSS
jgi:type II secretory ATPase GspE/PulE/Tfp pilus assembly ATPase PilB-like protein